MADDEVSVAAPGVAGSGDGDDGGFAAGDCPVGCESADGDLPGESDAGAAGLDDDSPGAGAELPVLPPAADRTGERVLARWGLLEYARPEFVPAGRVPLAGLLLAVPALASTGLLEDARAVYGAVPDGFYGLDTVLCDAVFRALIGGPAPRAPPGSTPPTWAGCWGWIGRRR